jgi:hypothetical protein
MRLLEVTMEQSLTNSVQELREKQIKALYMMVASQQ